MNTEELLEKAGKAKKNKLAKKLEEASLKAFSASFLSEVLEKLDGVEKGAQRNQTIEEIYTLLKKRGIESKTLDGYHAENFAFRIHDHEEFKNFVKSDEFNAFALSFDEQAQKVFGDIFRLKEAINDEHSNVKTLFSKLSKDIEDTKALIQSLPNKWSLLNVEIDENIDLRNYQIKNLAKPTVAGDAVNKEYVDNLVALVARNASMPLGGPVSFLTLSDVPGSYSGQSGKYLRVKSTEDGLEFSTVTSGASLTVEEEDGSPSVASVDTIKFTNGSVTDNGDGSVSVNLSPGAGGDVSSNTATSVDGEVALFSGTGGKTIKRATGSGIAKLTSGVLGTAVADTDYLTPATAASTYAPTAKGVTNGDSHDHSGGDGAQIDYNSLANLPSIPTQYTDEMAQDAVGAMIADTATIDLTYTDATPELKADVKDGSITYAKMQNVSASGKVLGRKTTGAGDVEEIDIDTDLSSVSASDDTVPSAKATKTALDAKAPTASPTFTGTVTLPTELTGVLRADSGVVSTDSDVTDIVAAASDTAAGKVELATAAETTTGTDATRAVTPDGLAGSDYGKRVVSILLNDSTALTTGDGKAYIRVPDECNGYNLVGVRASRVAGTGTPLIQIHNVTQAADMLTTRVSIDSGETDSSTAVTAAVIDTANDDVATGDRLRIDVDDAGTSTTWCEVQLSFQLP
jgi:hypothetical protein